MRAACALARYDGQSRDRWSAVSPFVTDRLLVAVQQNPSHFTTLLAMLRPVRDDLLPPLSSVYRSQERSASERFWAANFLADYATDTELDHLGKQRVDAGRQALTDGSFNVAARELKTAVELRDLRPKVLTANESRDLNQLQRQADFLAHVHSLPLRDVLMEALRTRNNGDWQARFEMEHKGKAVIFDDVVRRDPATGRLVLGCFEVRAEGEKAIVALDDLKIFLPLRLEEGHRLIFGGRLRSLEREAGGAWVVRFEPDSGVLLTDAAALAACSAAPPDADALRTLRRQEEWLRDLPAQMLPP
jgi:hypothetical protein